MNAYEIPNLRFSLPAGEDVAIRRFVAPNAAGEGVIATTGTHAIGVSMNQAADGEVLEISDGIVMVEAGGVVAAGSNVSVGATGLAVAATAATALSQLTASPYTVTEGVAGTIIVGIALTGATAATQLIAVKIA
jgi:hypothetical protein